MICMLKHIIAFPDSYITLEIQCFYSALRSTLRVNKTENVEIYINSYIPSKP